MTIRETLVIARRELLERVKSKWFVAMTLLGPIGIIAMIVVPALIAAQGGKGAKIDIIDRSGVIAQPLAISLTLAGWRPQVVSPQTPEADERARLAANDINGFLVVPEDALDGGQIVYRGDNASPQVKLELGLLLAAIVQEQRGKRENIDTAKLRRVLAPPNFEALQSTGEDDGTSGGATFFIGFVLAFILYMVITLYGVGVMRSVVEEKTSRVMELLVATVKPRSLMAGKIVGVGAAGLIQVAVWLGIGAITLAYRDTILGALGASGGGPELPGLEIVEVAVVLAYFVIGFFFYAAMYAAVGAMVSSDQETQQVQMPITMLLVIGFVCFQVISNDPRGTTAVVMTNVPFWSPLLMPMRFVLGGATGIDVVISLAILVVSMLVVVRVAAKIYRVGVLMYGKRPSLRELIRWIAY